MVNKSLKFFKSSMAMLCVGLLVSGAFASGNIVSAKEQTEETQTETNTPEEMLLQTETDSAFYDNVTVDDVELIQDAGYMTEYANQVLAIVNEKRAQAGVGALTMNADLVATANVRAIEITQSFSHIRPDGTSCFTAFPSTVDYPVAENIAAGQTTPTAVMTAWMNSSGHKENILDGDLETIGISCYYDPNSTYKYYWVQCFGGEDLNPSGGGQPLVPEYSEKDITPMYRLYNPNSGEHFYTANYTETETIVAAGWQYEGVAWYAPKTGAPVYRLYNPNAGDHHYTLSESERDVLVTVGWQYEGIAWYSGGTVPMYRVYNPNAVAGAHHYSTNLTEINYLVTLGWNYEGQAWSAVK